MRRRDFVHLAAGLSLASRLSPAAGSKQILVYTRNFTPDGKGYVHDNVATSVETIKSLGSTNGFGVTASDDPKAFTPDNLRQYAALVFSNSNNEAFTDDAQRAAFRAYIQAGGGYVGLHSATGSERQWPYYWAVAGGKFVRHPKQQKFLVRVADSNHPATRDLPREFEWTDECYYHDHMHPDNHALLVTDPAKLDDPQKAVYPGDRFGNAMPLAWSKTFDGGRQYYLALGHNKPDYENPILRKLILGGIRWSMGDDK